MLFAVVEVNQVLIMPNYFKAFIKLRHTVLTRHISLEICEGTRCDVDHFFLAHALLDSWRSVAFRVVTHSAIVFFIGGLAIHFWILVLISIFLIRSLWHVGGLWHHVLIVLSLIGVVLHLGHLFNVLLVLVVKELRVFVLLHIALRRLVGGDTDLFKLALSLLKSLLSNFPCLFCLAGRFCFFGFFHFLLLLHFFKFNKHVLVVENRVGKFIFKNFSTEELLYPPLNLGWFQYLVDCRPHSGIFLEHAGD